jgi:hypothetical protein
VAQSVHPVQVAQAAHQVQVDQVVQSGTSGSSGSSGTSGIKWIKRYIWYKQVQVVLAGHQVQVVQEHQVQVVQVAHQVQVDQAEASGTSGSSGSSGTSGSSGSSGTSGSSGSSGTSGSSGSSGTSGSSGSSGTSGSSGSSGTSGSSGSSGTSGIRGGILYTLAADNSTPATGEISFGNNGTPGIGFRIHDDDENGVNQKFWIGSWDATGNATTGMGRFTCVGADGGNFQRSFTLNALDSYSDPISEFEINTSTTSQTGAIVIGTEVVIQFTSFGDSGSSGSSGTSGSSGSSGTSGSSGSSGTSGSSGSSGTSGSSGSSGTSGSSGSSGTSGSSGSSGTSGSSGSSGTSGSSGSSGTSGSSGSSGTSGSSGSSGTSGSSGSSGTSGSSGSSGTSGSSGSSGTSGSSGSSGTSGSSGSSGTSGSSGSSGTSGSSGSSGTSGSSGSSGTSGSSGSSGTSGSSGSSGTSGSSGSSGTSGSSGSSGTSGADGSGGSPVLSYGLTNNNSITPGSGDATASPAANLANNKTGLNFNFEDDDGNDNETYLSALHTIIGYGGTITIVIEDFVGDFYSYNATAATLQATQIQFTTIFVNSIGGVSIDNGIAKISFFTAGLPSFITWSGSQIEIGGKTSIDNTNVDNINTDGSLSSNGDYGFGSQIYVGSDLTTLLAGRTYRLDGTSWVNAVSNSTEAAASGLIAISTGAASTQGMLLRGIVYTGTTGTGGDKVYLASNGVPTTTIPTTPGDFVRIIGHVISSNIIYFNPSNDYIELS